MERGCFWQASMKLLTHSSDLLGREWSKVVLLPLCPERHPSLMLTLAFTQNFGSLYRTWKSFQKYMRIKFSMVFYTFFEKVRSVKLLFTIIVMAPALNFYNHYCHFWATRYLHWHLGQAVCKGFDQNHDRNSLEVFKVEGEQVHNDQELILEA